jgi:DNA-binding CsgD family transcriptional regulator
VTWFPLRYARANLLVGRGGQAAGLYRVAPVAYPYLPVADKWLVLRRLERFAHVVGADFSLWRVQRAYPAERYGEELAGLLDARHADAGGWRRYLAAHAERLRELASHVPELYLAVSLAEGPQAGVGAGLVRSADRARRRLEELAGVAGAKPLPAGELEALALAEQRIFERLSGVLRLERASTRDLQWLLRRAALRGVGEPELDRFWAPDALIVRTPDGSLAYEPLEHDLWRCANAAMSEDPGGPPALEVEAEEGRSLQALLCLGALPDEAAFPGPQAELLFAPLEQVEFPVDAVLHARWVGNREALGQVRKRILDVEHSFREQEEGALAGPGWLAEEDRVLAREYEAILQSSAHPPMLYASISLAVGAPDRPELERRVEALREQYGQVRLHRPRGLQHQLFFDHLPRTDGGLTPDYEAQLTVEQFGALVAAGTQHVGSERGVYLGYSPAAGGRPVRYDPTAPSREARASAVLLAGTLGSGKTVAAQAICFAAERRGSLIVDFDPSRVGVARPLAVALRLHAVTEADPGRVVERLRAVLPAIAGADAPLVQARALVDLGRALRRLKRPTEAREPLREALAVAERIGAKLVAETARNELGATGERRRKTQALAGLKALTPSERRVASLAAEGMSNKEIAQTLFVTLKTVEIDLTQTYRKLGLSSRRQLPEALTRV